MAEHLANIFGTERDRVNCPFYFKIGTCRHGDRCSRMHNKPTISPTLLMPNMYQNPAVTAPLGADGLPAPIDARAAQDHFEDFYEDVFEELAKFGEIENLNVCDNLADHMIGNVYVKFRDEDDAARAFQALSGRYYNGRPILCEFSPVTDFREATCRQYEENTCGRGGYCNFMHLRQISRDLRKVLFGRYKGRGGRSRSRSPGRRVEDGRGDRRGRGGGGRYDDHRGGGGGRHDDNRGGRRRERSRERSRSRGRDERRGPAGGGGRERESSAERRARIASWNAEREPSNAPTSAPASESGAAPPADEAPPASDEGPPPPGPPPTSA